MNVLLFFLFPSLQKTTIDSFSLHNLYMPPKWMDRKEIGAVLIPFPTEFQNNCYYCQSIARVVFLLAISLAETSFLTYFLFWLQQMLTFLFDIYDPKIPTKSLQLSLDCLAQ